MDSYTTFSVQLCKKELHWDLRQEDTLYVPVEVKNTGSRPGSQVVQLYCHEEKGNVLVMVSDLFWY